MKKTICLFVIISSLTINICAAADWKQLYNGRDLEGWTVLNGQAKFYPEKGMSSRFGTPEDAERRATIIGECVSGQPNSFLCTDEQYGDFILEYQMKIDEGLNSGVQIRSESLPEYNNGRVHGYQVEGDTAVRAWSGGIYDEARRGWLYPLDINPPARKAFVNGQWNQFRVEAFGDNIRTYVNGVLCADLVDNMTPKGFIALQVHSIGKNKELEGKQVCWRNLRILTEDVKENLLPANYSVPQVNLVPNTISEKEQKLGWKLLWDGKTTKGWRSPKGESFPQKGWKIQNGQLTVLPSGGGGDIITTEMYKNFELKVDFKFSKGANSGIKYFVNPEFMDGSYVGCEFQILDDKLHPDAKKGVDGNRTLASLYDLIPAKNQFGKRVKRDGWNNARIVVKGDHVEHWFNNQKMLEYKRSGPEWLELVAKSKFKNKPRFGQAQAGHILLQDHGNEVSFRNIKIKPLD